MIRQGTRAVAHSNRSARPGVKDEIPLTLEQRRKRLRIESVTHHLLNARINQTAQAAVESNHVPATREPFLYDRPTGELAATEHKQCKRHALTIAQLLGCT